MWYISHKKNDKILCEGLSAHSFFDVDPKTETSSLYGPLLQIKIKSKDKDKKQQKSFETLLVVSALQKKEYESR